MIIAKRKKASNRKRYFLRLLKNDREVRQIILNIVKEELIADACQLKNSDEYASEEKDELQPQAIDNKLAALVDSQSNLEYIKKEELEKLRSSLQEFENKYYDLDKTYSSFLSLDNNIINMFDSIIDFSTPISFLVSGTDLSNLNLMYEKICMQWKLFDEETLDILRNAFDFLFENYSSVNPDYMRIETAVDDIFDHNIHERTANSPPVGKISQVILAGYTNKLGTKIIKSFVVVG